MHYRCFYKGLTGWGKWSGDDHIALLQQMVFVVGTSNRIIRATDACRKAFIEAVDHVQRIYLISKMQEVSEYDLNRLHESAKALGPCLKTCVQCLPAGLRSKINLNRPKLHAILHFRYLFS